MYKLGIIGGMGPMATVEFYKRLVLSTPADGDSKHIDMVILNHATIPDRTECILNNEGDKFLGAIKKDFDIMNRIGVRAIAIPCNTSHYYFDKYKEFTDIEIINMVESTICEVAKRKYKKACVFSTKGTEISGIYRKYADIYGLECLDIEMQDRDNVMKIIYDIKATNKCEGSDFNRIVSKYCNDETMGIVACTELSLIKLDEENKHHTIDALDILVKESLDRVLV